MELRGCMAWGIWCWKQETNQSVQSNALDWKFVKPHDNSQTFQTLCVTIDGKHTGKSKALKQSQHNPVDFGDKVAAEFMQHYGEGPAVCPSLQATEE